MCSGCYFEPKHLSIGASLIAQLVKNPPAMKETPVRFLGQEDPLEKGQATHSSILGLPLWLSWCRIRLQCRRPGFGPWVGRSPGEGIGYPLQYSGLENSMVCIVHGVAKSQTRLSDFHNYLLKIISFSFYVGVFHYIHINILTVSWIHQPSCPQLCFFSRNFLLLIPLFFHLSLMKFFPILKLIWVHFLHESHMFNPAFMDTHPFTFLLSNSVPVTHNSALTLSINRRGLSNTLG